MNQSHTRVSAALLALLLAFVSAFPVFAEGGDGSGGGDNHDKPLILDSSSVATGAENVDPNTQIALHFTKNVVNVAVRENNKKCFSVTDSKGSSFPITVEMGDDQIDPTDEVKRTVTIVPDKPYKAGETYLLKISKGLAAKNGRDVLESDVYISFTIAGQAAATTTTTTTARTSSTTTTTEKTVSSGSSPVYSYGGSASPNTTSTTRTAATQTAETTASRIAASGRQPITAATKATTAAADKAEKSTAAASSSDKTASATKAAATTAVRTAVTTTAAQTAGQYMTLSASTAETLSQTEPVTSEETTAAAGTEPETALSESESASTAQAAQTDVEPTRRISPAVPIGIIIALSAAGAVIGIFFIKKKKG